MRHIHHSRVELQSKKLDYRMNWMMMGKNGKVSLKARLFQKKRREKLSYDLSYEQTFFAFHRFNRLFK